MKKTLLSNSSRIGRLTKSFVAAAILSAGVSFSASAQWIVYEANELPTEFETSKFVTASVTVATQAPTPDQPVVSPQFEVMNDPAQAGNKLLRFQILGKNAVATGPTSEHQSYLFRQNFNAENKPTAATIVVRAKGLPGHDRAFELDLDFAGFRETVYITNPTMNATTGQMNPFGTFTFNVARSNTAMPDQSTQLNNAPLAIDPTQWHTYRFTKNGNTVRMYIDENPIPYATGVSASASTNNYYRIGDGSSGITVGMQLDYIAWDPSGAYSPVEKALPSNLLLASKSDLVKKDKLGVYPNPSNGQFFVTHPTARKGATVEVYTISGVKVASFSTEQGAGKTDINATSLRSGIYTVVYSDGTQRVTSRMIKG